MILAVLLWTLAAAFVVAGVLLCLPVHLSVEMEADADGGLRGQASVRLVSARWPAIWAGDPFAASGAGTGPTVVPGSRRPRRRRGRRGSPDRTGRLIRAGLAALPDLLADTVRGVTLDRLEVEGRAGTGDPAETGALYGQLCPLIHMPWPRSVRLSVGPLFDRAGVEGQARLALHAVPIRLAWPTLRTGAGVLWRAAW